MFSQFPMMPKYFWSLGVPSGVAFLIFGIGVVILLKQDHLLFFGRQVHRSGNPIRYWSMITFFVLPALLAGFVFGVFIATTLR
jgi:hypothetical protein